MGHTAVRNSRIFFLERLSWILGLCCYITGDCLSKLADLFNLESADFLKYIAWRRCAAWTSKINYYSCVMSVGAQKIRPSWELGTGLTLIKMCVFFSYIVAGQRRLQDLPNFLLKISNEIILL